MPAFSRFKPLFLRGEFASVVAAKTREKLYDDLIMLGKMAEDEAAEIKQVAKELKGDPMNSSRYLEATDLIRALDTLKQILDRTYNPIRSMPGDFNGGQNDGR